MRIQGILICLMLVWVNGCVSPPDGGSATTADGATDRSAAHDPEAGGGLASLADSLTPLRGRFSAEMGRPRLVALLSPT